MLVGRRSYAYNTQAIAGIDVPRYDDDVTLYLFYTIVQKYGWEFMDKYIANNPQWVRGHLGTARAVAIGQAAVTFDTMTDVTLSPKKNNQPTDVAFSDVDPLPIWPQTTAIFKDAPHPNAAKLYITWFPYEGTAKPKRHLVDPIGCPSTVRSQADIRHQLASDFRGFITNEKPTEEMRKRFEGYVGKPKGEPVIHLKSIKQGESGVA